MKKIICLFLTIGICQFGITQTVGYKCYPTNWWVGMKNTKLQLMIHGDEIGKANGYTITYPGVKIEKINKVENGNYLFIDLNISPAAKPGTVKIKVTSSGSQKEISFELKSRRKNENGKTRIQGVNSADFIYLLMPDRFSNDDPANDKFADMRDTVMDRSNSMLRHGGDIQGIINHLDYFKELGVTTLWLTPVLTNDMPAEKEPQGLVSGYHGYWITDHYEVDKRYGGNTAYHNLVETAHKKGLKIIQDAVYNHVGIEHWFINDRPMKNWLNNWPAYQGTNHREEIFIDPYASSIDKNIMIKGWFVPHLPDLNLANPYVANFIIQNTIWATEEFGIDGWRVDTYKYNDENFLIKINKALANEFPTLTGFGEVSSNTVTASAYLTKNNINTPIKHNILGVTDFPLCYAMLAGLNENYGWTNGVNRIYMTLAQDILYKDPAYNCIFLDNHDMDRLLSMIGEDYDKYKMGITWLLTLRGIPQLYYGTEILMKNKKDPSDGQVRLDFPGGWAGDKENKFKAEGRNSKENEAFNYVKKLANYRLNSPALKTGKLMQYIPENGLYVYFRYDNNQTVMVVTNSSDKKAEIKTGRFTERINGFNKMKNVLSGEIISTSNFSMEAKQIAVFELLK